MGAEPIHSDIVAPIMLWDGDARRMLKRIKNTSISLVVTSPPYNIGKSYERSEKRTLDEYKRWVEPIAKALVRKLKPGGHLCWQSGNYIQDGCIVPLDYIFYEIFSREGLLLRNRIIWHFNFGLNASRRFSGRYETLLWFTNGNDYTFNLDPVRVRQRYPGKRHPKTHRSKAGELSGNPKGKNPGDVWVFDPATAFLSGKPWLIPNVKANHVEKTIHPCQFPLELAERCILALTNPGDTVLDPFVGTGTTALAAAKHGRPAIGIDLYDDYLGIARERYDKLISGELPARQIGRPVATPDMKNRVSRLPKEWTGAKTVGSENDTQGEAEVNAR
jgi:DNA modification methylase